MLAVDDPIWFSLPHAFGKGSEVSDALSALRVSYSEEALHELVDLVFQPWWITAAAVPLIPHLVQIAAGLSPSDRLRPLAMVGRFLAVSPADRDFAMPKAMKERFVALVSESQESLARARSLLEDALRRETPNDTAWMIEAQAAYSCVTGYPVLGMAMYQELDLDAIHREQVTRSKTDRLVRCMPQATGKKRKPKK